MARDYVEAAIRLGFPEIAVTDHIPLYFLPGEDPLPEFAMAASELPQYVAEVKDLAREYRGTIDVLLGIEADYVEGHEAELRSILETYEWDVVLGSVHWVAGDWIDSPGAERRHETEGTQFLWSEYFRLMGKACESGLFDVMTHFDLPKKFGHHRPAECEEHEDAAVAKAVLSGVAVEVSSAGLRKKVGEEYPGPSLLKKLVDQGVGIVFSSDAHAPAEVGWGIRTTRSAAERVGVREHLSFRGRSRRSHPM
jgi:histidinol-phosphatase (PHP family)